MGKRVNYGFEKRQKEIKRKKKAEERLARKRAKREPTEGEEQTAKGAVGEDSSGGNEEE